MKVSRRLLLALPLALILAGCKAPVFSLVESTPATVSDSTLERPVRLGVIQQQAPALPRFRALVAALRARKHEVVLLGSDDAERGQAAGQSVDYVLEPKFRLVGWPCPKLNLLVAWMVGPLFGAPGWAGLQYDYEVETELTLTRPGSAEPLLAAALLRDTYDLAYTSYYYAVMIYGVDGGVVTGFQSAFDELTETEEINPVEEGFLEHTELKEAYLRRIVNTIENAIARDHSAQAPPQESEPVSPTPPAAASED